MGLDSLGFHNGLAFFCRNVQRARLPIMFALVAFGKGVGSTTNEHRLCEVGRASMTAGHDLDGMLARSEDVLGYRDVPQERSHRSLRPRSIYDRQGQRAMRNPLKSDAECLEIDDCIKDTALTG